MEKLSIQRKILKNNNFYDPENLSLVHHVNQALKANLLFKRYRLHCKRRKSSNYR